MKQIIIEVPDNCELKQDGNTYTIVEKEKKITYEDVARKLFKYNKAHYICSSGVIQTAICVSNSPINCTSQKQAEKLLAINKLMNVAKYLNGSWKPDWEYQHEKKYYIWINNERIRTNLANNIQCGDIYFKTEALAKQAIEILGEETIKLALCTDY